MNQEAIEGLKGKAKDTIAIANLIGADLKTAGKNMGFIYNECNNISNSLQKYGFPKVIDFEYRQYPNDPLKNVVIIIPIKDNTSDLVKYKIEVYFAPENVVPHKKISAYSFAPTLENLNLSPLSNN